MIQLAHRNVFTKNMESINLLNNLLYSIQKKMKNISIYLTLFINFRLSVVNHSLIIYNSYYY